MLIFLHHSFLFALLPRKWKHLFVELIKCWEMKVVLSTRYCKWGHWRHLEWLGWVKALNTRSFERVEADRFVKLAETVVRAFKGIEKNQLSWVRSEVGRVLLVELISKAVFFSRRIRRQGIW